MSALRKSKLGLDVLLHGEQVAHMPFPASDSVGTVLGDADLGRAMALSCAWEAPLARAGMRAWLSHILPENGSEKEWRDRAQRRLASHGCDPFLLGPEQILWGNSDAEFPGAVSFRSRGHEGEALPPFSSPPQLAPVSDGQIRDMLTQAIMAARGSGPRARQSAPENLVSLSGIRPKIGLALVGDAWRAPAGGHATTHVIKVEDSQIRLPGEALVESVCQRALAFAGLRAAPTAARVFGDVQTVISKRSDRRLDAKTGRIERLHQEEWAQAAGILPSDKYDIDGAGPRWTDLAKLLRTTAPEPEQEMVALLRLLSASILLGNCDMHRKNVGLLHEGKCIALAPAYDFSSVAGLKGFSRKLAVSIFQQKDPVKVRWAHWQRFAAPCRLGLEQIQAAVLGVAEALPDAFAEAWAASATEDEAKPVVREGAEKRLQQVAKWLNARKQSFLAEMRAPGGEGRQTATPRNPSRP